MCIPPSITQDRHAGRQAPIATIPGRAQPQPLRPKAAPKPGASQRLTGLVYVTKPSVDEQLLVHRVEALDVCSYTCSFLQIAAAYRQCTHALLILSALAKSMYTLHWVVIVQKSLAKDMAVELSEYCRRMLSFPTFWRGKSELHPAARGHRVLLAGFLHSRTA